MDGYGGGKIFVGMRMGVGKILWDGMGENPLVQGWDGKN